jgi:hypothetical protein
VKPGDKDKTKQTDKLKRIEALANIVGINNNKTPSAEKLQELFDSLPEETQKIIMQEIADNEENR